MDLTDFSKRRFLIVGGTTKAGTTSLYTYLASHPQVGASSIKETRFFLDSSYPVPIAVPFSRGLNGYADFFLHCSPAACGDRVLMEASPDYLYSATSLRIADLLPRARIVFSLREPVDRLVSWFKYAKQKGLLAEPVTFEEYVQTQMNSKVVADTPVHLRALEQGRYSLYLAPFLAAMRERVLLVSFERLTESPQQVMSLICEFVGIEPGYYADYRFTVENKSHGVKYPMLDKMYRGIRRRIAFRVHSQERVFSALRRVNSYLKLLVQRNYQPVAAVMVDGPLRERLHEYYAAELALCQQLRQASVVQVCRDIK